MQINIDIPRKRLIRYFLESDFEHVGDIRLEIRPLPSDIPEFDLHYYDSSNDSLVILFKCDKEPSEKILSANVSLFLDPATSKVAGVKISGIRDCGIDTVTVGIRKNLVDYQDALRKKVLEAKGWNEKLKWAGSLDLEKRKLNFFMNEIPKRLVGLSATGQGFPGASL